MNVNFLLLLLGVVVLVGGGTLGMARVNVTTISLSVPARTYLLFIFRMGDLHMIDTHIMQFLI